jgi:molecular chaperone GrpE
MNKGKETASLDKHHKNLSLKELLDLAKAREAEAEEYYNRYLSASAEMENQKKRLVREKSDQIKYANEEILRQMMPVVDNLERAMGHASEQKVNQGVLDGLEMTLQGFLETLKKFGISPLEPVGEKFDPNFHEAVMLREDISQEENTVLSQIQKGYLLKDRLLRPAMVVVSKKP